MKMFISYGIEVFLFLNSFSLVTQFVHNVVANLLAWLHIDGIPVHACLQMMLPVLTLVLSWELYFEMYVIHLCTRL
jgi:hypothetical protein